MFTSHFVRAASTSKAKTLDISLSQILKKGQWPKESIWQKFYNEEIFPEATHFSINIGALNRGRRKLAFGDMRIKVGRIQY